MKDNKQRNSQLENYPANEYDDGDIPPVDLPQDLHSEPKPANDFPMELPPQTYPLEMPADVIPDEVPRRDGPGGDSGKLC